MSNTYKKLFMPIVIKRMEIKNRIVLPAMGTSFCPIDGHPVDRLI